MKIVITGGAGFIGAWVGKELLERGYEVIAIDNFSTTIYDASLKKSRVAALLKDTQVVDFDIVEKAFPEFVKLVKEYHPDCILHCAAIAGIRYAQRDPQLVVRTNVEGMVSVFEAARIIGVPRVIYASSSSVYGINSKTPFHEDDPVTHPVSHYAATKRSCELLAEVYRHSADVASTGLRFFTAYGPWGRPDMAYYMFTRKLLEGENISLFADGKAGRDFTSIHDIVRGVCAVIENREIECKILNLGNSHPVTNGELLGILERLTGKKAQVEMKPLPPEDVPVTYADISRAHALYGWKPQVNLEDGLKEFVEWYKSYYRV